MLVLSRKPGERILIGDSITITVVEIDGRRVKLAFDAPDEVRILRGELAWCAPRTREPKNGHRDSDQLAEGQTCVSALAAGEPASAWRPRACAKPETVL